MVGQRLNIIHVSEVDSPHRVTLLAVAAKDDKLVILTIESKIASFQRYTKDIRNAMRSFKLDAGT